MDSSLEEPRSSPYHGQDLKAGEIRLLTIVRTTSDGFSLRTDCHELTEDLEFDAISYVWGTVPTSIAVNCNSVALYITPTVFEMLGYLYMFKPDPERPIWIDAVCINQANAAEKAVQVPLMHQIYRHASSVVVWLGRSTSETKELMTGLSSISAPWEFEPAASEIEQRWTSPADPFWKGLNQVLSTDWVTCLWTFQEAVLATNIILLCGELWLDLDQLLPFIFAVYKQPYHFFGKRRTIDFLALAQWESLRNVRQSGERVMGAKAFVALLHSLRRRCVGEEVDRIWALYGLLNQDLRDLLAPLIDYSEEARRMHWLTLIDCINSTIRSSQGLWPLEIPKSEHPKPSYLPTWCPDLRGRGNSFYHITSSWNMCDDTPWLLFLSSSPIYEREETIVTRSRQEAIYGHVKRQCPTTSTNTLLSIRGFSLDIIAAVVEEPQLVGAWEYIEDYKSTRQNYSNNNPIHRIAMGWVRRGLELARRNAETDQGIPWEFLMTIWTDHRLNEKATVAYQDAMETLGAGDFDGLDLFTGERYQAIRDTMTQLKFLVGHSFFSTIGGRFGIAKPGCKNGDRLCVFYGGEPLYIVRPHDSSTDFSTATSAKLWDFVGTAYVPYLMDQHTNDNARQGPDRIFTLA